MTPTDEYRLRFINVSELRTVILLEFICFSGVLLCPVASSILRQQLRILICQNRNHLSFENTYFSHLGSDRSLCLKKQSDDGNETRARTLPKRKNTGCYGRTSSTTDPVSARACPQTPSAESCRKVSRKPPLKTKKLRLPFPDWCLLLVFSSRFR